MDYKPSSTLVAAVGCVVLFVGLFIGYALKQSPPIGSVDTGQEYEATSTAPTALFGQVTGQKVIKTGAGAVGSVVITGLTTGAFSLYDATTSSILLRTGQAGTSTIHIATFAPSTPAGTYTLDASFTNGLLLVPESGSLATSTITWR